MMFNARERKLAETPEARVRAASTGKNSWNCRSRDSAAHGGGNALGCGFSWEDPSARGGGSRRGRTFPTAAGARPDRWTSTIFSISSLPWAARRVTRGGGRRGAREGGEKKQRAHAARVARFPRRGSNIRRFRKRSVAAAPRVIRAPARSETRRGDAFGSRAGSTREETAGSAVASRRNARETRGGVTHVIVVLALVVRGRTAVSRGRHLAFDERGHVQRAVCRGDARVSE